MCFPIHGDDYRSEQSNYPRESVGNPVGSKMITISSIEGISTQSPIAIRRQRFPRTIELEWLTFWCTGPVNTINKQKNLSIYGCAKTLVVLKRLERMTMERAEERTVFGWAVWLMSTHTFVTLAWMHPTAVASITKRAMQFHPAREFYCKTHRSTGHSLT